MTTDLERAAEAVIARRVDSGSLSRDAVEEVRRQVRAEVSERRAEERRRDRGRAVLAEAGIDPDRDLAEVQRASRGREPLWRRQLRDLGGDATVDRMLGAA